MKTLTHPMALVYKETTVLIWLTVCLCVFMCRSPPTAHYAPVHSWRLMEEAACPWKFTLRSKVIPLNHSLISCPG